MAFLFKRKNKKGEVTYYIAYKNFKGKLIKTSTKCKSKQAANQILMKYETNNFIKRNKIILLSDFQIELLNYLKIDYAPGTLNIYKNTFKYFMQFREDKPLNFYCINDIIVFRSELSKLIALTTANIYLRTLKAIFNFAIKFNYIDSNPCKSVKQFITPKKNFIAFTEYEKNLILKNISDSVYKDIILFAFHTGCRLNEILNIQIKDIDFKNNTINICNKDNFRIKTNENRIIPVSDTLIEVIKNRIYFYNNIFDIDFKDKYLFSNKAGNRFDKSKISKMFKNILRKLNFDERYHFHCIRHTFASELANKNVPINQISLILGHKNIETTKIYLHSDINSLRNAVNSIVI